MVGGEVVAGAVAGVVVGVVGAVGAKIVVTEIVIAGLDRGMTAITWHLMTTTQTYATSTFPPNLLLV